MALPPMPAVAIGIGLGLAVCPAANRGKKVANKRTSINRTASPMVLFIDDFRNRLIPSAYVAFNKLRRPELAFELCPLEYRHCPCCDQ